MSIAAPSGAWLLVECGVASPVALPVPRQACLGLARAVLFSGVAGGGRAESADGAMPQRMLAFTRHDPAVAAWVASEGGAAPSDDGLVRRLAECLLVADDMHAGRAQAVRFVSLAAWQRLLDAGHRGPVEGWLEHVAAAAGNAGDGVAEGPPADEALVLRDAVRAAAALAVEAARFGAAVAEARLAAMRELAYGAGHEINNPLANIATRAQSLLLQEQDAERRRKLSTIVDQAFRARDMIGGLMLFARPPKPRPTECDVGDVVAAVLEAAQPLAAARSVRLEQSPPPRPVAVVVDRSQAEEALRAIVVNAVEAVEPRGHVVVSVHVAEGSGGGGDAGRLTCAVVVADDGHGMDDETMRRAFDPFFSGREAGRGAGLGLSKAWRLIGVNGGDVAIDSRIGHGTRVTVTLPRR